MKIAVLGYGTVGSGVVDVLEVNSELIASRAKEEIEVKYVLELRDFPGSKIQDKVVHDYDIILNDPEIGVVVEVMGGVEPANTFVKKALLAGKNVVTSNKALVAKCGADLLKTAKEQKVNFLFEASVGGGIPILRALGSSLTADEIEEIAGILNGTTNYMMTKMFYEGADYAEVLKEAQANGFAEKDPTADVEGYDACRKIAILASIISGKYVDFEDIYTEGITGITTEDMRYARALGMNIKLLAECKRQGEKLSAMVAPVLLPAEHPLYSVNGVFNAVFVKGNMLGDAMFYGSGAGKLPTASAVVADVIAATMNQDKDIMNFWTEEKLELEDRKETTKQFLVRVSGEKDAFAERIRKDFGEVEFVEPEDVTGEFGFVTPVMSEGDYEEKAKAYEQILHMIRLGNKDTGRAGNLSEVTAMKYVIVLGDGMAGEALEELGGKTTLEAAKTPAMDQIAPKSEQGLARMVPQGMAPGSDTANLSVAGYDPKVYYTGRSPLEALSIGVDMDAEDVAFRCNIVTLSEEENILYEERTIIDHSSDEISTEDAAGFLLGKR